jgi:hypothetical protein
LKYYEQKKVKLEVDGSWEKLTKEELLNQTRSILSIDSKMASLVEKHPELRWKFEWKLSEYTNLALGILKKSFNWELTWNLESLNLFKFDIDGESGIDAWEFDKFSEKINLALTNIIQVWSVAEYDRIIWESWDNSFFSAPDKYVASNLNFSSNIDWAVSWAFEGLTWVSEHDLKKMKEHEFSITSLESYKELWIVLAKEAPQQIEDLLKLVSNIPSALILLPRYLNYRIDLSSSNIQVASEAEIKLQQMTESNSALAMVDLLWEKWIEALKKIMRNAY